MTPHQTDLHVLFLSLLACKWCGVGVEGAGICVAPGTVVALLSMVMPVIFLFALSSMPLSYALCVLRAPSPGVDSKPCGARSHRTFADERDVLEKLPSPHVHRAPPTPAADHGHPFPHEGRGLFFSTGSKDSVRSYTLISLDGTSFCQLVQCCGGCQMSCSLSRLRI